MKVRRFAIKCINEEACYELLNKITEEVSARWMKTEVKGNMLLIEALGLPYELKSLRYEIEELKKEIEARMMPKTKIKVEEFPKVARLTVPMDALVEALRLSGIKATLKDGYLEAEAPFEDVLAIASKMKEAMEADVVRFRLPYTAKKAVAALSAAFGVDPEEVVKMMEEEGFIEPGDFKYEIREDWRKIIKRLSAQLRAYWG